MGGPFGGFRRQTRGISVLALLFGSAEVRDVFSWKTEIFSGSRNLTAQWGSGLSIKMWFS